MTNESSRCGFASLTQNNCSSSGCGLRTVPSSSQLPSLMGSGLPLDISLDGGSTCRTVRERNEHQDKYCTLRNHRQCRTSQETRAERGGTLNRRTLWHRKSQARKGGKSGKVDLRPRGSLPVDNQTRSSQFFPWVALTFEFRHDTYMVVHTHTCNLSKVSRMSLAGWANFYIGRSLLLQYGQHHGLSNMDMRLCKR